MKELNVVEKKNILIAEFMGFTVTPDYLAIPEKYLEEGYPYEVANIVAESGSIKLLNLLDFHKSWDWLMPVVEKIENTYPAGPRVIFKIEGIEANIYSSDIDLDIQICYSSKINSTFTAIVQFIQWYNSQPRQDKTKF